jgi:RNA polymerase sigma factor CnrH
MTLPSTPESANPDPRATAADAAFRRYLRSGDAAAIADLFDLAAGDLHRTALHLVGDDATAHDLVQITFLAALGGRGFDERRSVLPWLAGILRNQAAMVHRRRSQQLDRERLGGERSEDPVQRAAELELVTEIEGALARLPEPYQPVVRLHVLHGLDAGAIAASLQRPGGTVRTQLLRGLARLRELLPVGVAGVLAGLLPTTGLAAVRTNVLAAAAPRGGAPVTASLAVVARPSTAWLALLAVSIGLLWWLGDDVAAPVPRPAPIAVATSDSPVLPVEAADVPAAALAGGREQPAAAASFELRGVVTGTVRGVDATPIAGAEVLLWRDRPVMAGATFAPVPAATARTDADGSFAIRGHGESCYLLARTADAISEHAINGKLERRTLVDGFELRLQPLLEQRGRLLDAEARPVANFAFGTHRGSSSSLADALPVAGFRRCELPYLDARTDRDGCFEVRAAANEPYTWEVQHPDHPMLRVRHRAADGDVELRLERGAELHGVVWTWHGAAAAGAEIQLADWPVRRAVCDASGGFVLRGVALRDGLWLRATFPGAALRCEPVLDATARLEVRLEPARVLAGRLLDANGEVLAGRTLRIVGDRTLDSGFRHAGEVETWELLVGKSRTKTDGDGAFRFDALYDGLFTIELRLDGGDFQAVAQARSGSERLELRCVDRSVRFTGTVRDALTGTPIEACEVRVWRPDDADGKSWSGRTRELATPGGELAFGGVAPGPVRLTFSAAGYADREIAARSYEPGAQRMMVTLDPARSLLIEVRAGAQPASGVVRAHLGDGKWLMLPTGGGATTALDLHRGRVRLERLPARVVTIVLECAGEDDATVVVDLAQPRSEPLVFDFKSAVAAPELAFTVIVVQAAKATAAVVSGERVDPSWLQRSLQNGTVALPTVEAKLVFASDSGKVLASGAVKPRAHAAEGAVATPFEVRVSDGRNGYTQPAEVPELELRLRAHAVVVTMQAEGHAPVTRRILPMDVAGDDPTFVMILPSR